VAITAAIAATGQERRIIRTAEATECAEPTEFGDTTAFMEKNDRTRSCRAIFRRSRRHDSRPQIVAERSQGVNYR
jgi:hypothetical protein